MRALAVDWSGKTSRPHESIWLASAHDGELVDLWNGKSREELVEILLAEKGDNGLVIGLDFAFSFPADWCRANGWKSPYEVWAAMEQLGPELLQACEPPFWGRPGKKRPVAVEWPPYRQTEAVSDQAAKSVFQIGGAGAVGTGSIRGMPCLKSLWDEGFGVWPFRKGSPTVVEIYPRDLTGPVKKNRWGARRELLFDRYSDQRSDLLERAAGSEDSFDAAISALELSRHWAPDAASPSRLTADEQLEGRIWRP